MVGWVYLPLRGSHKRYEMGDDDEARKNNEGDVLILHSESCIGHTAYCIAWGASLQAFPSFHHVDT